MGFLDRKRILITGGTGSLGSALLRRLLKGEHGQPDRIVIFSRDEAKQYAMNTEYSFEPETSGMRNDFRHKVEFRIGDIRDKHAVVAALKDIDIIFHAAALKQVPSCEYFPYEAVKTNIQGPENIIRAIYEHKFAIETVVSISTDKACKPVNTMGMSKAIQERVFIQANMRCSETRFVCVRYGNVLGTRGSVIPLFTNQIKQGGPVTITAVEMTRFLLTVSRAIDTIFDTVCYARPGEIYVPRLPSAHVRDIAKVLIGSQQIEINYTGVRPGEKMHELLVGEEETYRTYEQDNYYVISPWLPELVHSRNGFSRLSKEYSSADSIMSNEALERLLQDYRSEYQENRRGASASI
jgi:FlaA1/EpsC-like NDP-sugar epimerase